MTLKVKATLKKLKEQNIITVILLTHPHPPKEARKILLEKTNHFKITSLFDEIHATKNYFEAKGEHIINMCEVLFPHNNFYFSATIINSDEFLSKLSPSKEP